MSKLTTIEGSDLFLTDTPDRKDFPKDQVRAKAKARSNLAFYEDEENLDPVVNHILKLARSSYSAYQTQRTSQSALWEKADSYYWMDQKKSRMPELTFSNVSASTYYVTCRRLADGAALVTFPSGNAEIPMQYQPRLSVFDDSNTKRKRSLIAQGLNQLAEEYMAKIDMCTKYSQTVTSAYKYANTFAYVPWEYRVEKRKRWENVDKNLVSQAPQGHPLFTHSDTGEVSETPHQPELEEKEYDYVCKDQIEYYPLKPESCFLDSSIDNLDRQTFFFHRSKITRPEIFSEARAGNFTNIDKITALQKWGLYNWESQVENQRKTDAGQVTTDSTQTEVYERWQVWMLLPKLIEKRNKKGEVTSIEWDQNADERRYVMEIIGPINGPCVVVRFAESQYWGNGIPYIIIHSHEDDVGAYRRGLPNLLEDQMLQEQIAKGQLMDNRTLLNRRPMVVLSGRVKNKSLKIQPNTTFFVTSKDAISQLQVSDLTGNIENTLNFVKTESEAIAQVPKFFLGQSEGGRTSATEFASIRDQGSAPALSDIKKLNLQIIGAFMRKLKEYAPQFLDKDVVVRFLGQNGAEMMEIITADQFEMELDVKEIAVTAFDNKQAVRQTFINLFQGVLSLPIFQGIVNPVAALVAIFKQFPEIVMNPEELIERNPAVQQALLSYQRQQFQQQDANNPQIPPPQPGEAPNMSGPSGGPPQQAALPYSGTEGGGDAARTIQSLLGQTKGA